MSILYESCRMSHAVLLPRNVQDDHSMSINDYRYYHASNHISMLVNLALEYLAQPDQILAKRVELVDYLLMSHRYLLGHRFLCQDLLP